MLLVISITWLKGRSYRILEKSKGSIGNIEKDLWIWLEVLCLFIARAMNKIETDIWFLGRGIYSNSLKMITFTSRNKSKTTGCCTSWANNENSRLWIELEEVFDDRNNKKGIATMGDHQSCYWVGVAPSLQFSSPTLLQGLYIHFWSPYYVWVIFI